MGQVHFMVAMCSVRVLTASDEEITKNLKIMCAEQDICCPDVARPNKTYCMTLKIEC